MKSVQKEMSGTTDNSPPVILSTHFNSQASLEELWHYFLEELNALIPEDDPPTTLNVMAERKGFRFALIHFFQKLGKMEKPPAALFMDQIERFPMSFVEDVQKAWLMAYADSSQAEKVPILMAGAIEGGLFLSNVWLNDYGQREALEFLCKGAVASSFNQHSVFISGGVPALVHALISLVRQGEGDNRKLRHVWEPISREISQVVDLVSARKEMARRLQRLSENDSLPTILDLDVQLAEAGLVRIAAKGNRKFTELRAPYFRKFLG